MPDNASAVATRSNHPLVEFKNYKQRAEQLRIALPSHITPAKFQQTLLTAIQQSPELLDCDRRSVWLACLKCATDGLLPDKREAVIVPFKERKKTDSGWQTRLIATYIPMVYGLRKKILQSGEVVSFDADVVYRIENENGYFRYEKGTEPPLNHAPMLEIPADEATDDKIIGAYSIATMKDGTKSYEFMRRFEIDKVRETSQTGATRTRNGEKRTPSGPWVDWFAEQCKKTVMKRHSKVLPMSTDINVERSDRELEVAASVAALISKVKDDEPTLLTDESGSQYDGETGEVHDDGDDRGNAIADEGTGSSTQSRDTQAESGSTASTAQRSTDTASQSDEDEPFDAEAGEARAKQEETANDILGAMSEAGNVVVLKRLYDDNQLEIAGLPDDLATTVEGGYDRALKRLGTTRAQVARKVAEAAVRETESAK
jgi:recombination protein RecT